jgi:hypothetical protein
MNIIVNFQENCERGSGACEEVESEAEIPDRAPNEIGTYPIDFNPPMLGII